MKEKNRFNPVGLLGFLGFLVIIWPITGQWSFIFSAGYFFFFKYWKIIPDELFMENVKSSALAGFFLTQIIMALTMFSWAFFSEVMNLGNGFLVLYWGNIMAISLGFIVFALKLSHLERTERQDIKDVE